MYLWDGLGLGGLSWDQFGKKIEKAKKRKSKKTKKKRKKRGQHNCTALKWPGE
jgi:hypothetical protein